MRCFLQSLAGLLVLLIQSCQPKTAEEEQKVANSVLPLSYSVVAVHPHDTSSYTQGLQFGNEGLYEGTGQYGSSRLLLTNLTTGKIIKAIKLDEKFFGEGITILRDTIYQLTWREKKVFQYTLDFKKINEFAIDKEGWGLSNNGKDLLLTNGSGELFFYNPKGMLLVKSQLVTENGSPTYNLNELEFVDGFLYANQYTTPYILKINPANGEVVAKLDLSSLWEQAKQQYNGVEVPNGIAYHSATKRFYITGKWWPVLFEIEIGQ
ncbi:MAG: glutaminyl-peptide cyclotransferase [Bacteroidetes bacterium]|nr:glutaminyl-peptide cyclotransferase [Bacteroidota bacterium]